MGQGFGIIQLPCVEQDMCGIKRWGQVEEQLNHPRFRERCKELLHPIVQQVKDFVEHGYEVRAVVGVDGSPSCAVNETCSGKEWCGEVGEEYHILEKIQTLTTKQGPGVMMSVLKDMFEQERLKIPFYAVNEANPEEDTEYLLKKICNDNH
ncbi:MAG: hypothetical protein QM793_03625 [Muricomes sp.]